MPISQYLVQCLLLNRDGIPFLLYFHKFMAKTQNHFLLMSISMTIVRAQKFVNSLVERRDLPLSSLVIKV